jgi:UDP-N-acetylmuramyl tripeptide synthase
VIPDETAAIRHAVALAGDRDLVAILVSKVAPALATVTNLAEPGR